MADSGKWVKRDRRILKDGNSIRIPNSKCWAAGKDSVVQGWTWTDGVYRVTVEKWTSRKQKRAA